MIAFRQTTIKPSCHADDAASTIGPTVFFALFVANDIVSFRRQMVRDLSTLAADFGGQQQRALDFDDEAQATKTLSALAARPHLVSAAIYTKEGKILGRYHRPERSKCDYSR